MLNGIQALRAIATLMVVTYHANEFLKANTNLPLHTTHYGAGCLDVFFVISGFILIYITRPTETSSDFLVKRLARIVPLYWLFTAFAIGLTLLAPWTFPQADLSAETIIKSFLFIPFRDSVGALQPLYYVGWTLNLEMVFFAVFAIALLAPFRYTLGLIVAQLVAIWLVAVSMGEGVFHDFFAKPYLLDIAAGCLLAPLTKTEFAKKLAKSIPIWPFMIIAFAWLIAVGHFQGPINGGRTLMMLPPAVMVVGTFVLQDFYRKPFGENYITAVGNESYSVYLTHAFFVPVVGIFLMRFMGETALTGVVIIAVVYVCTLVASPIANKTVEVPVSRWLRKQYKRLIATEAPEKPAKTA